MHKPIKYVEKGLTIAARDKAGNFYTCKASPVKGGGRGFDTIYPHHGTVLKISPDGTKYQVIATGLPASPGAWMELATITANTVITKISGSSG